MKIVNVSKENASEISNLMLPYIYEEYIGNGDETDIEYIVLAAVLEECEEGFEDAVSANGKLPAASVLVIQPEATGDLNIVSVYTIPSARNRGYASMLLDKALVIARRMFKWEEDDDDEELILLKTLYRLPDDKKLTYEEYLMKNHFTDFVLIESKEESSIDDGLSLDVWSASCEVKFIRDKVDMQV
ncbi:GNAT family N-acetyltransferase [Butyrivibrio sp. AE3004]|uniref:GNAT family N-acetyltransferase n=1 Tax=Butyrivibrio sp. AE3004 TaxID=1506994 RepID=UPI0018CC78E6|nr:GNAT family N-acetyltransferase [Butyrivibrio sp. AE3004]